MKYLSYKVKEGIQTRKFLKDLGFSKRSIEQILKEGYLLNEKKVYKSQKLKASDQVKIPIPEEEIDYEPIPGKIKIAYEDENTLVINKDPGITINSKGQVSLANLLAYYFKEKNIKAKIRFVNRLDMSTSGLLIVAKNKFAHGYYQDIIEKNLMEKKYLALVEGRLDIDREVRIKVAYDEENKKYKVADEGKVARTIFKTRDILDKNSIIECRILTGKTHQIRLSLSSLGHPIVGDRLYGSEIDTERFYLHSYYLKFKSFYEGENIAIKDIYDFKGFIS